MHVPKELWENFPLHLPFPAGCPHFRKNYKGGPEEEGGGTEEGRGRGEANLLETFTHNK